MGKQLEMWRDICNESHRNADKENDNRRELEAHIRHLHAKGDKLQADDRRYLMIQDVEEYLRTATTTQMIAWVSLAEEAIKKSIKRADQDAKRNQQLTSFGFTTERIGRGRYKHKGSTRKHVR